MNMAGCTLTLLFAVIGVASAQMSDAAASSLSSANASTAFPSLASLAVVRARSLTAPNPVATINAEFEESDFFENHGDLLRAAWREHGLAEQRLSQFSGECVIDPALWDAVAALKSQPSPAHEAVLKSLFDETSPGVFSVRLLRTEVIASMRAELERVATSRIPTRRPNGMNRFGVILDEDVDGAVSHGLSKFVKALVDEMVRPLGRTLFPDLIGADDDVEQFAFTVRYQPDQDTQLAEHRDASVVTLNLNLNAPGEGFGGSAIYFLDPHGNRHTVGFTPGMALIHLGSLRHAALPIHHGERENLIVWLFGADGYVRAAPYAESERLTPTQRWGDESRHSPRSNDPWFGAVASRNYGGAGGGSTRADARARDVIARVAQDLSSGSFTPKTEL